MAGTHEVPSAQAGRPDPIAAATQFVQRHFPTCTVALLAGSVARGEGQPTSDLDLVVITADDQPHWATFVEAGWPIEVFIQTPQSYPEAFARTTTRRWPLLLVLCTEGLVLVDRAGLAAQVKAEAHRLLDQGPAPLQAAELAEYRYNLTWLRDDLADAADPDEARLLGHDLATTAAEFYLAYQRRWLGRGKWLLRVLRQVDPARATAFTDALTALYQHGDKRPLLQFADAMLDLVGGRRFEGLSATW